MEYGSMGKEVEGASTGDHPVRRGILRDIDEMEKLVDNLFNFELAAYAGAHTPVSGHLWGIVLRKPNQVWSLVYANKIVLLAFETIAYQFCQCMHA